MSSFLVFSFFLFFGWILDSEFCVFVSSYLQAHDMIREITGFGDGHGPFISIHDGFQGTASWANFLPGSDRINLDTHPYFAFDGQPNDDPIDTWGLRACNGWGPGINQRWV